MKIFYILSTIFCLHAGSLQAQNIPDVPNKINVNELINFKDNKHSGQSQREGKLSDTLIKIE